MKNRIGMFATYAIVGLAIGYCVRELRVLKLSKMVRGNKKCQRVGTKGSALQE